MILHHFYHIYCNNNWSQIVPFHLECLKRYGLLDSLTTFNIGLVGNKEHRDVVKHFLDTKNIKFDIVAESNDGWEQVTMNKLYEFSQNNEGYVLYAHSKGAVNNGEQNKQWRKSMTWYNVVKWRDAVNKLDNCDAVGCHWHDFTKQSSSTLGGPHTGNCWFAGTFWWSKLDLLRQIGAPGMSSRYDAEVWIGNIRHIKPMNVYDLTNVGYDDIGFYYDWEIK